MWCTPISTYILQGGIIPVNEHLAWLSRALPAHEFVIASWPQNKGISL